MTTIDHQGASTMMVESYGNGVACLILSQTTLIGIGATFDGGASLACWSVLPCCRATEPRFYYHRRRLVGGKDGCCPPVRTRLSKLCTLRGRQSRCPPGGGGGGTGAGVAQECARCYPRPVLPQMSKLRFLFVSAAGPDVVSGRNRWSFALGSSSAGPRQCNGRIRIQLQPASAGDVAP